MATKQATLGNKGKRKQSLHPEPDSSPCSMSSASARRGGTKCKKNSGESSRIPAEPNEGLGDVAVEAGSEACIPFLPSSSSMEVATTGSSSNEGPGLLEAAALLSEGLEKEETQRNQCGESFHSVKTRSQSRLTASVSEVESIQVDEITAEEVVDLTSDSEESVVVDLTHNDSVIMVEEDREWQDTELKSQQLPDSLILSSDDDSELKESNVFVASKWRGDFVKDRFVSSKPLGTVSCPVCLDSYSEIVDSGRLVVSTKCGHIFCSQCLCDSLRNTSSCPTCREKLSHTQYHPIYI